MKENYELFLLLGLKLQKCMRGGRRGPLSKAVSNEAGEVTKAVAFPCPRGFFSEQAEPPSDSRERGKDPRVRRNHTHVGEGACAPPGAGASVRSGPSCSHLQSQPRDWRVCRLQLRPPGHPQVKWDKA